MKEQNRDNKRGVFYGVIGVATLVVAIIGATFAYFTAQGDDANTVTGNMATVNFGLSVTPVVDPGKTSGMIPMSNNMIETATNNANNATCVDDNGNAVCQIYKITVTNNSTATMFVDGYVALTGGSGLVTDYTGYTTNNNTTMRWAQVFKQGDGAEADAKYSTAGDQILGADSEKVTYGSLDAKADTTGFNQDNIKTAAADITGTTSISGNSYSTVKTNFVRVSDHALDGDVLSPKFDRTKDFTSMLVLSQQLQPTGDATGKDVVEYYFAVWLSETGNNQTAEATPQGGTTANPAADNFFNGLVSFVSAQGSEVTATFSNYTAVASDQATTTP